ncbi:MAG: type 4a pilus biogenesis protein PilO [Nitrospira sp.]
MKERLTAVFYHPFAPLLPWASVVLGLLLFLFFVHEVGLADSQSTRERLEKDWAAMRQSLKQHREARKAQADLNHVWALLPAERDFAPLALGISDEAKRDRVTMPALSYKTEPTSVAHTSKGLLQGPMSGRYEDLRRFIHKLETADELLFIEDLELARSGGGGEETLTFNVKIASYLRTDPESFTLSEAGQK